ncbi:hypothetical protein EON66_10520 [archaeon]|nr:MAG: hypothetical protein EON66_10520 [archaeon]
MSAGLCGDFPGEHAVLLPAAPTPSRWAHLLPTASDGSLGIAQCMAGMLAQLDAALVATHGAVTLDVLTSCTAVRIDWSDAACVSVSCVPTAAGRDTGTAQQQFHARHLICTLPHNVLLAATGACPNLLSSSASKEHVPLPLFYPDVPAWKQHAWQSVRMGQYKKVVLAFEEPPLPPNFPPFLALVQPPSSDYTAMEAVDAKSTDGRVHYPVFHLVENYARIKTADTPIIAGILFGSSATTVCHDDASKHVPWRDDECVAALCAQLSAGGIRLPRVVASRVTSWETDGM